VKKIFEDPLTPEIDPQQIPFPPLVGLQEMEKERERGMCKARVLLAKFKFKFEFF
jgi:hypothetical protein